MSKASTTSAAQPGPERAKGFIDLKPRKGDRILTVNQLLGLDFFKKLDKANEIRKYPGSLILRRFRKDQVICQQGKPGHSAFYVLTDVDVCNLKKLRVNIPNWTPSLTGEIRRIGSIRIFSGTSTAQPSRWWPFSRRRSSDSRTTPDFLPNDGPEDVDSTTRCADLFQADVFGEMSCMTYAPRSATVIADEDCWMLEFNRFVFDMIYDDADYRANVNRIYRERTLDGHLRGMKLFKGLKDDQVNLLRTAVSLEVLGPEEIICEEGDKEEDPDVFLIRLGVVQVVKNAVRSLTDADVSDWTGLCKAMVRELDHNAPAVEKPTIANECSELAHLFGAAHAREAQSPPETPAQDAAGAGADSPSRKQSVRKSASTPAGSSQPAAPAGFSGQPGEPADDPCARLLEAERLRQASAPPPEESATASPASDDGEPLIQPALLLLKEEDAGFIAIRSPEHAVVASLTAPVQDAVRTLAGAKPDESQWSDAERAARRRVLRALNKLFRSRDFVKSPAVAALLLKPQVIDRVRACSKGIDGIEKAWSHLDVWYVGRWLLRLIYERYISIPPEPVGPPRVLAYRTRGDVIGEMALVNKEARSATCIACDHPPGVDDRKPGRLELVRIKGAVFRTLMQQDPELERRVKQVAGSRTESDQWKAGKVDNQAPVASAEFQELGFVQGQRLLAIDLDSCTRCGDCMRACVETHDDGKSRLFLDGPRFDRFLIPSACRQCLNPLCMMNCPVGSIERAENFQIEIRDWCIGCSNCAEQCPYDSIQMHKIGILPETTAGWRFAPRSTTSENWYKSGRARRRWPSGLSPFYWTDQFRSAVAKLAPEWEQATDKPPEALCFWISFDVRPEDLKSKAEFKLVLSPRAGVKVWVNQQPVSPGTLPLDALRRGQNTLAVEVPVPARSVDYGAPIFSASIIPVPEVSSAVADDDDAEEVRFLIDLAPKKAVVCDLCSHLPGQEPACVAQCPHDAAFRFNPLTEFGKIWNR